MAGIARKRAPDVETLLGGATVVYGRNRRDGALDAAVRDGLPFRSFESVAEALALGAGELAGLIGVAPRTMARRKHDKTLSAIESDRLVAIARVASLAEETLGSREHARAWLRDPITALGGVAPIACLDTEPGRRQVEDVLYQISYGIIS